ncbi:MAG: hypothetical protein ACH34V_01440 [Flavobacterium sp.]|uniref:Uncharacterized protein n=1 Tax=Flavobacterium celericrescens TaxID=2709780 RepID=A0ABX0IG60_9FLAO|nr:hypothetical protein [Flavobacterium celericrescens]NHM04632.1 hypothetical protein [Flavobacterium celericrescens]
MELDVRRIDLLSNWQKHFTLILGKAFLRERNNKGELVTELLLSSTLFDNIMMSNYNFRNLDKNSVVYKYCTTRDKDENCWAENKEEECERIEELYQQLISIKDNIDFDLLLSEYEEVLKICLSAINNNNKLFLIIDSY